MSAYFRSQHQKVIPIVEYAHFKIFLKYDIIDQR